MNLHNIQKFIDYMDKCEDFDFFCKHYNIAACAADCFDIKSKSAFHRNIQIFSLLDIDHVTGRRLIDAIGHLDSRLMIAKDVSFALRSLIRTRTIQWPT